MMAKFNYTICDACGYNSDKDSRIIRQFWHFEITANNEIASGFDVCDECSPNIWKQAQSIGDLFHSEPPESDND